MLLLIHKYLYVYYDKPKSNIWNDGGYFFFCLVASSRSVVVVAFCSSVFGGGGVPLSAVVGGSCFCVHIYCIQLNNWITLYYWQLMSTNWHENWQTLKNSNTWIIGIDSWVYKRTGVVVSYKLKTTQPVFRFSKRCDGGCFFNSCFSTPETLTSGFVTALPSWQSLKFWSPQPGAAWRLSTPNNGLLTSHSERLASRCSLIYVFLCNASPCRRVQWQK